MALFATNEDNRAGRSVVRANVWCARVGTSEFRTVGGRSEIAGPKSVEIT